MDEVKSQYQRWVYPPVIEDLEAAIASGYWEIGEPTASWPIYWPHLRSTPTDLLILSAGCGTNQAAYYAFKYPDSKVIGIDLSESSLAHQQVLKDRHNLANLELHQHDILKLPELGHTYDMIVSTGVIHHMPDPKAGLQSLASCLKPNGIANLMVYSYTLRTGVYMLQRAFRDLGFLQVPEDVALIQQVLLTLHPDHPVHKYVNIAPDLHDDAGIVDTFLHPQDQAYTAGEIFDLTRAAGLEFLSWQDPFLYRLDVAIPEGNPLRARIYELDPQKEANICDMLTQQVGTHRWCAAHPDYVTSIRIPFGKPEIEDCFAMLHQTVTVEAPADLAAMLPARCKHGNIQFTVDSQVAEILRLMATGVPSIGKALRIISCDGQDAAALRVHCDQELKRLWQNGHVYLLLPEQ